jgi:branched-subunit amino acid ABC-type transport system permease component
VSRFLAIFIAGGVSGALYSLIAAGLVVSYTATGIFNLGYGGIAFTSAFLYYELHTGLGWPIVWAAIVTIGVFCPLLGLLLDKAIFRNLTRANESSKILATVGILIALPAFAK